MFINNIDGFIHFLPVNVIQKGGKSVFSEMFAEIYELRQEEAEDAEHL